MLEPLFNGLLTGLFLQLALGPVFFYILGITMDSTYVNSLFGILAVTLVDYIYIVVSILGLGKLLEKERPKRFFGVFGGIVLIVFGILILYKGLGSVDTVDRVKELMWTPFKSFTSCFVLTISSPLTIVFWSGVFSVKAMEKNYEKKQLTIFGLGAGGATFIFLSLIMAFLAMFRTTIPETIVQWMNLGVGIILILYGLRRSLQGISSRRA